MLVTTNLYLLLTFASEIQRRVDFMYNNNDYGNILMIIYLSSLRHALAAYWSLVTPRSKALKAFSKGRICLNLNITRFFLYSTTTVRQILPVIIAGHRQRLPVQVLECTYLLGLQAGMETAIYRVSPNHPTTEPTK